MYPVLCETLLHHKKYWKKRVVKQSMILYEQVIPVQNVEHQIHIASP